MKKSLGIGIILLVMLLTACSEEEAESAKDDQKDKEADQVEEVSAELEEETEEEKVGKKEKENETSKDDDKADDEDTWDDVKNKDKIIGKSDKDYSKITKSKPSKVRSDKTGNWKKSTFAENVDIEEYLLSYSDLYMEEDEIHFIINFNYNTTTWISEMNGLLYAEVREHVEKEEHDASTLGNGMTLKGYVIYPDGDIEETE